MSHVLNFDPDQMNLNEMFFVRNQFVFRFIFDIFLVLLPGYQILMEISKVKHQGIICDHNTLKRIRIIRMTEKNVNKQLIDSKQRGLKISKHYTFLHDNEKIIS